MHKTKQIAKGSGKNYRVNIDSLSFKQLQMIIAYNKSQATSVSLSVIIRRALRQYWEYLNRLDSSSSKDYEALELLRAAKGF